MQKKYFFLLINMWLLAGGVFAQTLQQSLLRADSLIAADKYDEALRTYKRVLFFADTSFKTKQQIYENMGVCYFYKNDYLIAAEQFMYASLYANSGFEKNSLRLQKAKCLLMAKKFDDVKTELKKTDTLQFPVLARQVHFYSAALAFAEKNYAVAENEFMYLAGNDIERKQKIKKLFRQNKKVNNKSEILAGAMSVVLPGTGQMYSGEIEKGLNSMLLTSAWLVLGYNTTIVYGVGHAIIAIAPWYLRYYTFGIKDAAQLVEQHKAEKQEKILLELLSISAKE